MTEEAASARRSIIVEFDFPHSPEKVWRILTEPALLAAWLMPNDFRPEIGHRFIFETKPIPSAGFDGIVHCQVLQIEPGRLLRYSWRGGRLDTEVTWRLTPVEAGTRLRLEHGGFGPDNGFAYAGLGAGWRRMNEGPMARVLADLD